MHPRIEREKKILNIMISIFCFDIHNKEELCEDCYELKEYAEKRLLSCPYIKDKPICSNCNIHCYNKHQQNKIKKVMKTVGPKMIYSHTKDALWYFYYKFIHKNQRIA